MNLDYIAGFFDEEGRVHFAISRREDLASGWAIYIVISISQKTKEVLNEIKNFLNMGSICTDGKWKGFRFQITNKPEISRFIDLIIDKVHLKKNQLALAKQALELFPGYGKSFDKRKFLELVKIVFESRKLINKASSLRYDLNDIIRDVEQRPDDWGQIKIRKLKRQGKLHVSSRYRDSLGRFQ